MSPEQKETAFSMIEMLVAELREQILFLREELRRVHAEAEADRRLMEEYRAAQEQQLAVKDAQIERLLRILESREGGPCEAVPAPPLEHREEAPPPQLPTASPEKKEPLVMASNRPVETLQQYFRSPSKVCRYLRTRRDPVTFHGYPSGNNVCWSPQVPKSRDRQYMSLESERQIKFCLHERHTECEFFKPESEELSLHEGPSSAEPPEEPQQDRQEQKE